MKNVIAGLEEGLQAIAEAIGGGGGSDIVPTPTAQDEGKVLTANDNGTASWENAQSSLPTMSGSLNVLATGYDETTHSYFPYWEGSLDNLIGHNGNDGDVLTLNDGGLVFLPPTGGVPDYSQASQGSVLNKQYSGELGWDRPEDLLPEGSLLPEITGDDDGKVLQASYNDKSGSYAHWVTPSGGGLPEITSNDNSKVLTAVYDDKSGSGYAEWQTPTGGSAVGHYNINIADLSYNDKAGTYSGSISIPIGKNIIGCNAVVVSSPTRMQCPVSKFIIENDGSTTWETIVISSSVYNEISTDYIYIDIIYA